MASADRLSVILISLILFSSLLPFLFPLIVLLPDVLSLNPSVKLPSFLFIEYKPIPMPLSFIKYKTAPLWNTRTNVRSVMERTAGRLG